MDAAPAQEIVIVAPRLPAWPGEPAFSAVAIDEDVLARALRLDEALRTAPGASLFRRSDSAAANPTVQGLGIRAAGPSGAGRALVTLDGVPQGDPFGGWTIWGELPPDLIARATIVRGAGAGPYGAGALTGSVLLQERDAPGFAFSAEGGSRGHARASGIGIAESDGFNFMLAAAAEHRDGEIPVREGRGGADAPVFLDAMSGAARVRAQIGAITATARVSAYAEDRGAGQVGAGSTAQGAAASLTLVSAPADRDWSWRLQAWARETDLANTFVSVAPDRSGTSPANDQYETPAFGWGANAAARWSGVVSGVELGVDVRAADGETHERFFFVAGAPTRHRIAGGETLLIGGYAEAWRATGPWLIAGGVRVDSWSASNGVRREINTQTGAVVLNVEPEDADAVTPTARLGVRRALGEEHYLRGALYAGFRPPTLNELHRPFRVGNDITEANPALEPERLHGFDIAFGADAPALSWSLGAFATQLRDPITNVTLGAGPGTFPPGVFVPAGGAYRQRQNAGAIDAYGVEAEAHGEAGDALNWRAALNYTHARVDGGAVAPQLDGLRPAQAPAWTTTAGLSWQIAPRFSLDADLIHESARFEDDQNTRTLAAATRLDLRFNVEIAEGVALYAALDNAGDAELPVSATADGIIGYAPSRAARFGLRVAR